MSAFKNYQKSCAFALSFALMGTPLLGLSMVNAAGPDFATQHYSGRLNDTMPAASSQDMEAAVFNAMTPKQRKAYQKAQLKAALKTQTELAQARKEKHKENTVATAIVKSTQKTEKTFKVEKAQKVTATKPVEVKKVKKIKAEKSQAQKPQKIVLAPEKLTKAQKKVLKTQEELQKTLLKKQAREMAEFTKLTGIKLQSKQQSSQQKSATSEVKTRGGLFGLLGFFNRKQQAPQAEKTPVISAQPKAVSNTVETAEMKVDPTLTPEKSAERQLSESLSTTPVAKADVTTPLKLTKPIASKQKEEPAYAMLTAAGIDELEEPDQPLKNKQPTVFKIDSSKTSSIPNLGALQGDVKVLKSGISSNLNELEVTVNKAVILNLSKPAGRVSISDPTIASALVISPTQIQLIGNEVGVANLLIWGDVNSPEHTVVDIHVHRDVSVLTKQLKYVDPGIQVVPLAAEDTVIMTGEAASREAAQLAVDLAKAFFKNTSGNATGGGASKGPISESPGSALPGSVPSIINLINVKGEPSTKVELARRKLHDIDPNIKLDIVPGPDGSEKAMLSGRVKSSSMISKAINTASIFYGQPGIKVLTGPGGNGVRAAAGDKNFPTGDAFNDNIDINVLQGNVMTDTSGNVVSMLEVAQKPQIKCSIQFIEVSKSNLDALGHALYGIGGPYGFASISGAQSPASGRPIATVDQDDSGAAYLASTSERGSQLANGARNNMSFAHGFSQTLLDGVTQVLSVNEQFALALSALEERRKARTLAEPTLTMLSGEKATFLAGGEVPIPIASATGQISVTYHEFGIRLNLVATYQDNGKIHMLVAPEISSVDPTNGVTTTTVTVPGFRTRRMQSTLELENGQSFVLAGLYNQDEVWSISRFPWAGRLPIIGSLMRNKWKTQSNNEMIVIIKPEVVMLDADSGQTYNNVSARPGP